MSLLTIRHADIGYKDRVVLHDVAFSLEPGTLCCLLGANGSGKTTLMRTILGVLPPLAGEIRVENTPLASMRSGERARRMGWVPQAHDGAFAFSVLDMVLMGLSPHLGTFARPGEGERDLACAQLKTLGILPLAQRNWATLSGGERQLTLIARALVQRPRLLLLDEPASSLDFGHQIRLLDTLCQLRESGMTLLMATHHPLHALAIADTVIRVEPDGHISQGPPGVQLQPHALASLYGVTPEQIHHHLGNLYLQES